MVIAPWELRFIIFSLAFSFAAVAAQKQIVYVGTYTGPDSKGIYSYSFDADSGALSPLGVAAELVNPSFVAMSPNRKNLYAVTEVGNDGKTDALVTGYAVDERTGALARLNSQSSRGGGACHLVVDHTGRMLIVANYGSGSVAAFPLRADGSIGESTALIKHEGKSVDPKRQRGPHAHAVVVSPDNRFVFVPDLGLDRIYSYRIDPARGSLQPNQPAFATVKAGAGPRHVAFDSKGKFAYAVDEMGSSVTAFRYDKATGSLTEIQAISTLAPGFHGENNSAEIALDAKGRYLYASNRGEDSIAVFFVEPGKGTLTYVRGVPTGGKMPRNFRLDPTGKFLLAANQNTNNIVVLRVNARTGVPQANGQSVSLHAPVCIEFGKRL